MSPQKSASRRRKFLKTVGLATSAGLGLSPVFSLAGYGQQKPPNSRDLISRLSGIDPKNMIETYQKRKLSQLSDGDLYRGVASLVSKPTQGFTSFVLHAPLEAMARFGLLPLVAPQHREFARIQLLTSAAVYQNGTRPLPEPKVPPRFPNWSSAEKEFQQAFQNSDPDGVEAIAGAIARQFGPRPLVRLLTPAALSTLTAAAHAHIGLWLLNRHGLPGWIEQASLLRAAARMMGEDPGANIVSFSGLRWSGGKPLSMPAAEVERHIAEQLRQFPAFTGRNHRGGIRNLIQACEKTGEVDRRFADFMDHDLTREQLGAAFRANLRVSAHSMLQDRLSGAKFIWSHNLTQPQAAWGLATLGMSPKKALGAALVWTTAYRYCSGTKPIDFNWQPEPVKGSFHDALYRSPQAASAWAWHAEERTLSEVYRELATESAIRNDQHLVKYVRACFDMVAFDPGETRLYLAAAAFLCAHWIQETPPGNLADNLMDGRSTPA